jgi:hypothetical protein
LPAEIIALLLLTFGLSFGSPRAVRNGLGGGVKPTRVAIVVGTAVCGLTLGALALGWPVDVLAPAGPFVIRGWSPGILARIFVTAGWSRALGPEAAVTYELVDRETGERLLVRGEPLTASTAWSAPEDKFVWVPGEGLIGYSLFHATGLAAPAKLNVSRHPLRALPPTPSWMNPIF